MMSRRGVLAGFVGLGGLALAGCAGRPAEPPGAGPAGMADAATVPADDLHAPGLDAVIDLNHATAVHDFSLARDRSNILGVLHKASEGGDWLDPLYGERRLGAKAAGLLWGAYHFGTAQHSGADQAKAFLAAAAPAPDTLLALDLELNERSPANSMTITQAEAFVAAIQAATGRWPLLYTHAAWAEGKPTGRAGRSLGGVIESRSILAQCDLWLADYRNRPQVPSAWANKGWRLWQYAGESGKAVGSLNSPVHNVSGIERCDRNFFSGDTTALFRYWAGDGRNQTLG